MPPDAGLLGWRGWVTRGGENAEEREYSVMRSGGGRLIFLQRIHELPVADTVLFASFFPSAGRNRALLETGLATLIAGGSPFLDG
jgi:hypothetical protein